MTSLDFPVFMVVYKKPDEKITGIVTKEEFEAISGFLKERNIPYVLSQYKAENNTKTNEVLGEATLKAGGSCNV